MLDNKFWYKKGLKDGIPIALGYFAVAFTLGIAAEKAGLTAFQTFIATGTTLASAGGYAGISVIAAGGTYFEMFLTMLIVNARYILMSCSLSQKISPKTSTLHRMGVAFGVTDEIFGISSAVSGYLNPFYNYGAMTVAIPGWASGAALGVLVGNILPVSVMSALSVGIFGMFLAIIVPPAKENKVIMGGVIASFVLSFLFNKLPIIANNISSGMQVIILTVVIALVLAILFPVKEEENDV
ncbi:MAG: AzlC family ABC transporter permease [Clostridia bacterium]|nr:AzlC family ABC transporter permease [Clostridia bacterium]MBQ3057933.1 AzlC family ABC transporter permease [Clostridia bacterium]